MVRKFDLLRLVQLIPTPSSLREKQPEHRQLGLFVHVRPTHTHTSNFSRMRLLIKILVHEAEAPKEGVVRPGAQQQQVPGSSLQKMR